MPMGCSGCTSQPRVAGVDVRNLQNDLIAKAVVNLTTPSPSLPESLGVSLCDALTDAPMLNGWAKRLPAIQRCATAGQRWPG